MAVTGTTHGGMTLNELDCHCKKSGLECLLLAALQTGQF